MLLHNIKQFERHSAGLFGARFPLLHGRFARIQVTRKDRLAYMLRLANPLDPLWLHLRGHSKAGLVELPHRRLVDGFQHGTSPKRYYGSLQIFRSYTSASSSWHISTSSLSCNSHPRFRRLSSVAKMAANARRFARSSSSILRPILLRKEIGIDPIPPALGNRSNRGYRCLNQPLLQSRRSLLIASLGLALIFYFFAWLPL